MNTTLNKWLDRHKISLLLGLSLVLFIKAPPVLRWFDFSAAPIDLGILTVIPLVVSMVLTFLMLTHILIKWCWPVLGEYMEFFFSGSFKHLKSWQKVLFYTVFFLGLFWAFMITLVAVL